MSIDKNTEHADSETNDFPKWVGNALYLSALVLLIPLVAFSYWKTNKIDELQTENTRLKCEAIHGKMIDDKCMSQQSEELKP